MMQAPVALNRAVAGHLGRDSRQPLAKLSSRCSKCPSTPRFYAAESASTRHVRELVREFDEKGASAILIHPPGLRSARYDRHVAGRATGHVHSSPCAVLTLDKHHDDDRADDNENKSANQHRQQTVVRFDVTVCLDGVYYWLVVLPRLDHLVSFREEAGVL